MVSPETVNRAHISELLAAAGVYCRPHDLQVEAREERWLVRLPGQRLAWFASSARGLEALRRERRVLRLLEAHCSFAAPRVLFESPDGELDVRSMVPGVSEPAAVYASLRDDRARAARVGAAIGAILAEQHSRIAASEVGGWLARKPSWPEPRDWIAEHLPRVVDDPDLIARADSIMEMYEGVAVDDTDRALVHTDLGFHNMVIDPVRATVHGVFDYDAAAWADRHLDFRYLVFDFAGYELLDAAIAVYEEAVGRSIQRRRVLLYNAACAISYLAYRAGVEPEVRWCGRTLAEDVQWSRHAITRALTSR